jgi:hypothetical protein
MCGRAVGSTRNASTRANSRGFFLEPPTYLSYNAALQSARPAPKGRTTAMKLYPKIIPAIARDVIATLMGDGDIEVETMRVADAEMDMAAILKEYLAAEERVNQATREALERRGYDHSKFNAVKREMADVRGFKMGDEGIDYIINQMIEFLLISRNVEEVFAEDHQLRKKIYQVFKKHLDVDEDIDREARSRLKHLSEGTQAWEVEYQKTVEQIRRNKGLI